MSRRQPITYKCVERVHNGLEVDTYSIRFSYNRRNFAPKDFSSHGLCRYPAEAALLVDLAKSQLQLSRGINFRSGEAAWRALLEAVEGAQPGLPYAQAAEEVDRLVAGCRQRTKQVVATVLHKAGLATHVQQELPQLAHQQQQLLLLQQRLQKALEQWHQLLRQTKDMQAFRHQQHLRLQQQQQQQQPMQQLLPQVELQQGPHPQQQQEEMQEFRQQQQLEQPQQQQQQQQVELQHEQTQVELQQQQQQQQMELQQLQQLLQQDVEMEDFELPLWEFLGGEDGQQEGGADEDGTQLQQQQQVPEMLEGQQQQKLHGGRQPPVDDARRREACLGKMCLQGMHGMLKEFQRFSEEHYESVFTAPASGQAAPEHLAAVERPMDLGAIQGRLEGGAYSSDLGGMRALMQDFFLMINNCRARNPPNSDLHEIAGEFESIACMVHFQVEAQMLAAARTLHVPVPGAGALQYTAACMEW